MAQIFLRSIDTRSVQSLTQEIRKFPRISNDQARLLAKAAKDGDKKAKNDLANSTMWLVVKLALKYLNQVPSVQLEDLIQNGSIGLVRAIEKYNPSMETEFFDFCSLCIWDGILDGLCNESRTIRIPHNAYKLIRKVKKIEDEYAQMYGCEPTAEDLAVLTGEKKDRIIAISKVNVDSYDSDESYDGGSTIAADDDDTDEREYIKAKVAALLSRLPKRERFVVCNLFGLDGCLAMDIEIVAERVHLSRERVRQIKVNALNTMRQSMAA